MNDNKKDSFLHKISESLKKILPDDKTKGIAKGEVPSSMPPKRKNPRNNKSGASDKGGSGKGKG